MCFSMHCPNYPQYPSTNLGAYPGAGGLSNLSNYGTTAWTDQTAALIAAINRLAAAIEKMEAAKAAPSGE